MSDSQTPGSPPPGRAAPRRKTTPPGASSRNAASSDATSRGAGAARVLTALVGIPLVALVAWQGGAWLVGVVALLAFIAMRELIIAGRRHRTPLVIELAYPLMFLVFFMLLRAGAAWSQLITSTDSGMVTEFAETRLMQAAISLGMSAMMFLAVPLLLLIFAVWRYPARKNVSLPSVALTTLAIFYVALFAFLPLLREMPRGKLLLGILLLGVWTGDTLAFYAGRAWGRAKLTSLSPGKTRAGVVAGFVATVAACAGIAALTSLEWQHGVALGALIGIAAPLGDLAESFWKRELEVKDLGNLLPGHGGILDRCDSLLFAAPVVYFYALWQLR